MSLDDKLREIVRNAHRAASERGRNDDDTIMRIKQAFADDAKQKLMDGSIHGVGVYEVSEQIADVEPFFTDIGKNTEQHESVDWNRMTGQEWYDRFEKELPKTEQYPFYVHDGKLYITHAFVKEAAKRAAGLSDD